VQVIVSVAKVSWLSVTQFFEVEYFLSEHHTAQSFLLVVIGNLVIN